MNKEITFQKCCNFIFAAKQYCLFFEKNLTEELLSNITNNHLLLFEENTHQYIILQKENELVQYSFENNDLDKRTIITSLDVHKDLLQKKGSCYSINVEKLEYFFNSNNNTLSTIHEEIDFELALRLRNSFFSSDDVVYVIFLWENGTVLLCEKKDDKDNFLYSHGEESIQDQKALEKIREEVGNISCTLKVLKSKADDDYVNLEDNNDFDHGVMVVEMDIPRSKPNLPTPGNINITQEDSIVTLDEPLPALTSGDLEILSKYGIDTIKRKDLRKGIFEGSVVIRDEELPQLGPDDLEVLKKYGIEIPDAENEEEEEFLSSKQFVFEESQIPLDEELPSLGHEEVEIFKKYGVNLDQEEKTTPRSIREAFEDSVVVTDQELPPLRPEDINILQKYGISLSEQKPAEKQELHTARRNKKKPQKSAQEKLKTNQYSKKSKVDYKLLIEKYVTKQNIIILGSTITTLFVLYWIMIFYKDYDERQDLVTQCNEIIVNLDKHHQNVREKINNVLGIVKEVKEKYPSSLGYPEPSSKITTELDEINNEIVVIEKIIQTANTMIQNSKESDALAYLKQKQNSYNDEKNNGDRLKIIKNLQLKVSHTMNMAQYMFNIRSQESSVRRVLRRLRENITLFSQLSKLLDEKLLVLNQKYPAQDGYPKPPKQSLKLTNEMRRDLKYWRNALEKIQRLLFSDNIRKALKETEPHENLESPDGKIVKDVIDSVEQTLRIAKAQAEIKAQKKEYLDLSENLKNIRNSFKKELISLKENILILDGFGEDLNIPKADPETLKIKIEAEKKITLFEKKIEEGSNLAILGDLVGAIENVKFSQNNNTLLISLKQVSESTFDAVKIAQSMKQKSEKGLRVAILLQKVKKQLLPLTELTSLLRKKVVYIQTNFENRESRRFYSNTQPLIRQARRIIQRLSIVSRKVNKEIEQEKLDNAIGILEKSTEITSQALYLIPKIKSSLKKVKQVITKSEKIKFERKQSKLILAGTTKINDYIKEMESNIRPLKKQILIMEKDFPSDEGYSEIPGIVKRKLAENESIVRDLLGKINQIKQFSKTKRWEKANSIIERYATQNKLNPNSLAEISKYRYEIQDVLAEARKIRTNKDKVFAIKDNLRKLEERHDSFEEIITKIKRILKSWKKDFPKKGGFEDPPTTIIALLPKVQIEYEELKDVISDGEDGLQSGEYSSSLNSINGYIRDVISLLPALKTAQKDLSKTIEKNKRISEDENFREQILLERKDKKILEGIKKDWVKSPGDWYSNLEDEFNSLERMQREIKRYSIKGPVYNSLTSNLSKIKNLPNTLGELGVISHQIEKNKGRTVEDILIEKKGQGNNPKTINKVLMFLRTKTISIEGIDSHSEKLKNSVSNLRNKLNNRQEITDRDVKNAYNPMRLMLLKYRDSYTQIESVLIGLK